jgi:hypothetical protein
MQVTKPIAISFRWNISGLVILVPRLLLRLFLLSFYSFTSTLSSIGFFLGNVCRIRIVVPRPLRGINLLLLQHLRTFFVESNISISVIFRRMTLPLSHSTQQAHLEFVIGTLHYLFFFVITHFVFLSFRKRRTAFC